MGGGYGQSVPNEERRADYGAKVKAVVRQSFADQDRDNQRASVDLRVLELRRLVRGICSHSMHPRVSFLSNGKELAITCVAAQARSTLPSNVAPTGMDDMCRPSDSTPAARSEFPGAPRRA
jgi:hypothetical protein